MTSKIWPPPTAEEEAAAAAEINNPFEEECEGCEQSPCICDQCEDCGCDPCECETCDICDCVECECPAVYVIYNTAVTVCIDCDGDINSVTVGTGLDDPIGVQNDSGRELEPGPLRSRALNSVAQRDWPDWDFE